MLISLIIGPEHYFHSYDFNDNIRYFRSSTYQSKYLLSVIILISKNNSITFSYKLINNTETSIYVLLFFRQILTEVILLTFY